MPFLTWYPGDTGPSAGLLALAHGYRNGVAPPGDRAELLAHQINLLSTKRPKVVFRNDIKASEALNITTATDTWRGRFFASPNVAQYRCRIRYCPVDDSEANAPTPSAFWTVTPVGSSAVVQPSFFTSERIAAATAIVPDHFRRAWQTWTGIVPRRHHEAVLRVANKFRVLSCTVWEVPRWDLKDGDVRAPRVAVASPIHDATSQDLFAALKKLWKWQRTHHIPWTRPSSSARDITSATPTNVLDGTTTAVSSTSPGFFTWPIRHGAIESFNSETNRETVPITLYAYFKASAGTATVTFKDALGTIGSVSTASTTGVWVALNTTWTVDTSAGAIKVDIQASCTGGGTVSVWAAGMYEFEA